MINEETIKRYCCEDISKIENYDLAVADKTQTWCCHHRMELIITGAVVDSTMQDLIDWDIYYNRPADELILLTKSEHNRLHCEGKPSWNSGVKLSEEQKKNMKGHKRSEKFKKNVSDKMKKYKWWNNGLVNKRSIEQPEGFVHGRLYKQNLTDEMRKSISKRMKGNDWNKGKHRSEETKRKQSESMKEYWDRRHKS